MNQKESKTACISFKGELADWGKHIYLPEIGFTLCGIPTVDYDKERYKHYMPADLPQEYKLEKWDITCERCLEIVDIVETSKENKIKMN